MSISMPLLLRLAAADRGSSAEEGVATRKIQRIITAIWNTQEGEGEGTKKPPAREQRHASS